ncbi:MerR family transcriptional regulator [Paenibacillus cymbidii]|uniref:MerR family transcriptional regulator n=1 Tax=Paenibacillus cymbidii TaxID=1639034 RepID=UPI00107FED01|nr:MerR family transcriptional regulator [Paenibacillus cymbidii]
MNGYKIEEAAAQTGLTKRTIRYYEEIGLIDNPDRTEGGIRIYTEADITKLKNIVLAKEVLGYSLQDLQEFLRMNGQLNELRTAAKSSEDRAVRSRNLDEMEKLLHTEIGMIDAKMNRMAAFQTELRQLLQRVEEAKRKYAE